MALLRIRGGRRLEGSVRVGGRKNSAVAVIPAALLASEPCLLENIPRIADVDVYLEILRSLGVRARRCGHTLEIDPTEVVQLTPPAELVKRMRASYYLLGVFLARFGEAEVPLPGGCDIGQRPIDQHLKGFSALGAEVEVSHGLVRVKARRLVGTTIYLDVVSVGATINLMLAATRAEGVTVIENAAREPHVVDVANFLNAMGARIVGAGTDVIKIRGTDRLRGAAHAIIADDIEAATFMMAACATYGDVLLENVIPKHLDPVTAKLREAGAEVEEDGDWVRVRAVRRLRAVQVKTLPYPGFPTDAQQPMTALLATAEGTSLVTDTIWESRFKHVDELRRMGARIRVEGRTAIVEGVERLTGAPVRATDLRAAAALVVAALGAENETLIAGVEHLERGYEDMEAKLRALGADVQRLEEEKAQEELLPEASHLRLLGRA